MSTQDQISQVQSVQVKIAEEVAMSISKHGRELWSRHEFYAILLEEVDELWEAIKADEPDWRVEEEAIQVAAMVVRYLTLQPG